MSPQGAAEGAALAPRTASNPALGGQLGRRSGGEDLGGASLRGLEDRCITADRILVDRVPEARVDVGEEGPFRAVAGKCVQEPELYLRLVRVREPGALEARAGGDGFALRHDRAIAAEGRNVECGKGVVRARDQEPVRGCGQEAERERFLLVAGEQKAPPVSRPQRWFPNVGLEDRPAQTRAPAVDGLGIARCAEVRIVL